MLGYIKPDKPELKVKELEAYKGYYCSLCKALGKRYGVLSRLLLSYDVTFFLIFILSLNTEYAPCFINGRCPFNLTKKCKYCKTDTDEFDFCAALSIIITYYKVKDNISDAGFFKKIPYFLYYPYISLKHRAASKKYPVLENIIASSIAEQSDIEKSKCGSVDKAANPSAVSLAKCFELFGKTDSEKRVLNRFGYCIGRFVYLCDAYDDYEKDKKCGNYNVFVINGYDTDKIKSSIRMTMCEASKALDLADFQLNRGIIENIVYDGLEAQLQKIIMKKEGKKNEEKSV